MKRFLLTALGIWLLPGGTLWLGLWVLWLVVGKGERGYKKSVGKKPKNSLEGMPRIPEKYR